MELGDDIKEGKQKVMVVVLCGCGIVSNGYVINKGVHKDAAGNNHRIGIRETNIQNIYIGAERMEGSSRSLR